MYDHNQLEIADSYLALYVAAATGRPTATRSVITERYEWCEDMANHLYEYARAQHHDLGIAQDEVLRRCHQGLLSTPSVVSEPEAGWVIRRLAELEGWAGLDAADPA